MDLIGGGDALLLDRSRSLCNKIYTAIGTDHSAHNAICWKQSFEWLAGAGKKCSDCSFTTLNLGTNYLLIPF